MCLYQIVLISKFHGLARVIAKRLLYKLMKSVEEGEELFICYNEMEEITKHGWDDVNSLWTLVQWGIPISTKSANHQLAEIGKKR